FPRLALEAGGAIGPGPTFTVEEGGAERLLDLDPTRFDVALLVDPPRLPAASLRALSTYVEHGGAVFLALGPGSDPASLQAELLPKLFPPGPHGAGGVRVAGHVARQSGGFLTLLPTAAGHPIFAGFRLGHGGALTGARFRECVALAPGSAVRVLARFSDGTPALLESPGQGVLAFTSSFDLSWG